MLTARNKKGKRVIAFETAKQDGPFYCPRCREKTVLRKGEIRIHHFAHLPGGECSNSGETLLHMEVKGYLYTWLKKKKGIKKLTVEKRMKFGRIADVYFKYKGRKYVVEIQHSPLSIEEIVERTTDYQDEGIFILWVLCKAPKINLDGEDVPYYSLSKWQRVIREMNQDGSLVYFGHNKLMKATYKRTEIWSEWDGGDYIRPKYAFESVGYHKVSFKNFLQAFLYTDPDARSIRNGWI